MRKVPIEKERKGDPILERDNLSIQGGMTIVAPAWRITDLLNSEAFETMHRHREPEIGRT